MPFTPVTYNTGAAPGLDGPAFNAMQTQYIAAVLALNPDLFTPFVLSGLTAAKDGTIATKLNLTGGTAYPKQADQNEPYQRVITAQSFNTVTASTTYYLDLNPDGTLSWATSHSGTANYLPLCSVTTDGVGNIVTVTDARVTATTLLSGMAGRLTLPTLAALTVFGSSSLDNGAITTDGSGAFTSTKYLNWAHTLASTNSTILNIAPPDAGTVHFGLNYNTDNSLNIFNYTSSTNLLSLSSSGSLSITGSLGFGSFFTPPNDGTHGLAQDLYMTANTSPNRFGFVIGDGSGWQLPFYKQPSGGGTKTLMAYIDDKGNFSGNGFIGSAGAGIPTTRNGSALSVPIYTGATTPSSPPTGSLWASA